MKECQGIRTAKKKLVWKYKKWHQKNVAIVEEKVKQYARDKPQIPFRFYRWTSCST